MQLLFLIVINFYLINSSIKFLQRKLDEIPNIAMRRLDASPNKLMLVGFGNYIISKIIIIVFHIMI